MIIFLKISQVERPTWHISLVMKHAPSTDWSLWLFHLLKYFKYRNFLLFFFPPQAEIARQQQSADSGARGEDMLTTSKGMQEMPQGQESRGFTTWVTSPAPGQEMQEVSLC